MSRYKLRLETERADLTDVGVKQSSHVAGAAGVAAAVVIGCRSLMW